MGSKPSSVNQQHLQPQRRSQRSLSTIKKKNHGQIMNGIDYDETDDCHSISDNRNSTVARNNRGETKIVKEDLISLERRVLVRAIDSFGSDYFYFQSKVFPVFGSSSGDDASVNALEGDAQIRARCRQILRSLSSSKR